jgi:putative transposase
MLLRSCSMECRRVHDLADGLLKVSLSRELALDALLMAVRRRSPSVSVLMHSDQGSQYGSDDCQRFCRSHGLVPSTSRRGNCWDNAVAESSFSSPKKARVKRIYRTRQLARADIFDDIESFYNRELRHSHLGGHQPRGPMSGPWREARRCPRYSGKSSAELEDQVYGYWFSAPGTSHPASKVLLVAVLCQATSAPDEPVPSGRFIRTSETQRDAYGTVGRRG